MKYFSEKIKNFIAWADQEDWILYTPELFKMYLMENSSVANLTVDEEAYLKLLYMNKLQHMGATGGIKADIAKFSLMNHCGWSEKTKTEETKFVETVRFDTSNLLRANTSADNHINENLTNDAVSK